jgi:hypothetical protein
VNHKAACLTALVNPAMNLYVRDSSQAASIARLNFQTDGMLGWAGAHCMVVVKHDGHVGFVPVADPSNLIEMGYQSSNPCVGCFPAGLALAGSIGIA